MKPAIVVVGSLNIDLVVKCRERPRPGETVAGIEHRYVPGGKGANQAFAASRLGGKVAMIGCIGSDPLGSVLLASLDGCGVDTSPVTVLDGVPTGAGFIILDERGENSIVVSAGANGGLTPDMVEKKTLLIEAADMLLCQLETPLPTVEKALALAHSLGKKTLVNLTPAQPIPDRSPVWGSAVLAVNEHEAEYYTGVKVGTRAEAFAAGSALLDRGASIALVTLGEDGSIAVGRDFKLQVDAVSIEVVDTTAAGDTYIGAFAAEWLGSGDLETAMLFASHAAALSVNRFGAQTSIPTEEEVRSMMAGEGNAAR